MKNFLKKLVRSSIVFFLLSFSNTVYSTNDIQSKFDEANEKYKQQQYYGAIKLYKQILEKNYHNFETYYNLANSYFRINNLQEAIYYYEKAFQISAHNRDLKHNMELTRSLLMYPNQVIPEPFHIKFTNTLMRLFSPDSWAKLAFAFLLITLVSVVFFLYFTKPRAKKILFISSIILLIFTLSSFGLGYRYKNQIINPTHAIVTTSASPIKSSPDISSADVYVVKAGMKVKVLSKLGTWYEVQVAEGENGWISEENIRLI